MKFAFSFTLLNLIAFLNAVPVTLDERDPMEGDLFEGDIAGVDIKKGLAQVPTSSYVKWTNGIVPYIIDRSEYSKHLADLKIKSINLQQFKHQDGTQIQTILSGMKLIEDQTKLNGKYCIRFVERTVESTYLSIFNGAGCWSYVGKSTRTGPQQVSLKKPTDSSRSSCLHTGIVSHELSHALGFWHEQSRADRDNYVKIIWDNIDVNQQHNFNKYTTQADTQGFPYDYQSIMHYEWNAFSKNGNATIIALKSGIDLVNASKKTRLTEIDVAEIRKYYSCT